MGKLEKILLFVMLFLVVCIVVVMALPDREGRNGFQALSPWVNRASQSLGQAFSQAQGVAIRWSNSLIGGARRGTSPPAGSNEQGNPIDSAISPVQGFGQEQKDLFKNTIP